MVTCYYQDKQTFNNTNIFIGITIDYEKGFWKSKIKGKEVPIIFTGMLSWQRAMDIWTRELLKFNIYRILWLYI